MSLSQEDPKYSQDRLRLKALIEKAELEKKNRILKNIVNCLDNFLEEIPQEDLFQKERESHEVRISLFHAAIAILTGSAKQYFPKEFNSEVSRFIDNFKLEPGDHSAVEDIRYSTKGEINRIYDLLRRAKAYIKSN